MTDDGPEDGCSRAAPSERTRVAWEEAGPFRRLALSPLVPPTGAHHSVYRIGDTLIDTGSSRCTEALLTALADDPPRRVLLTHQHEDHVGNLGPVLARFGPLPVHAPRALCAFLPTFVRAPPYRHVYWGSPHPIPDGVLTPYDDGDVFDTGVVRLRAQHLPGHTPPHHVFVAEHGERSYVLSGDLYASKPLEAFLESAMDDTIRSYRAIATIGARLVLLPTHGRIKADGAHAMLDDAADFLARSYDEIHRAADALGTRHARTIAAHLYGEDPVHHASGGEMGKSVFVRSALEPIRTLPAPPVD